MDVALDEALAQLRDEVAAHNQAETAIIAELFHGPAAWGSLLVDRMLEEHVAEHAAFWALLCGTQDEVADRIIELAEELDAHMAAEERTFLSPVTLRDDVIRTRTRELDSQVQASRPAVSTAATRPDASPRDDPGTSSGAAARS